MTAPIFLKRDYLNVKSDTLVLLIKCFTNCIIASGLASH